MGTCCAYEVFRLIGVPDLASYQEILFNRYPRLLGVDPWKAACQFKRGLADTIAFRVAYVGNAAICFCLHAAALQPKPFIDLVVLGIAIALVSAYRLHRRCFRRAWKHEYDWKSTTV